MKVFVVGNEADHYAGGSRPVGWASSDYTAQFLVCSFDLTQEHGHSCMFIRVGLLSFRVISPCHHISSKPEGLRMTQHQLLL